MAKRKNQAHDSVEEGPLEGEGLDGELFEENEETEGEDLELGEEERAGEEEEEDDEELLDDDEEEEDEGVDLEQWFTEMAGYNETHDWSTIEEEERSRHQELLAMPADQLAKIKLSKMAVFDRWAAAHAFTRAGLTDRFQEACRSIIRARSKHKALAYDEIHLELIGDLAETDKHEDAFVALDKFHKTFPKEEEVYKRVRGLLLIESGKFHEGKTQLDEVIKGSRRKGEIYLELGDELVALGHPDLALVFFDKGKDIARRRNDPELITSIDESARLAHEEIEVRED